MPIQPISAIPATNPSFQYSASSTSGADYIAHYQYLNGTWQRKWVYGSVPTGTSGPPTMSYSYIELYLSVSVDTSLLEDIQLSGTGPYIIKHNVDYDSDSSAGGFGTSGIFYTSQAGVVLTLAPSGTTSADVSGSCTKTFTLRTALQQGGYNESLDTSGSLGPYFTQDVVGAAKRLCRDFRVDLLDI